MHTDEQYQLCVEALKTYLDDAGFSDVVIGLSGGIDSALTCAMSVDAVGAERVHGILLPGPYSSEHSYDDAQKLAENLGVETQVISICEPFEAYERILARACGGELDGVAAENTQARCRMSVLMALSNTYNWMLVNTGNKSEAMMGYSTLYGDTAGAFAPLGGLYKTDVYALARWRNAQAEEKGEIAPIPQNIFIKPPSAELSPDQEDEKSMGINYEVLDNILFSHIERGQSAEELKAAGFNAADVDRVLQTIRLTEFKRAMEPPYPTASFYR